MPGSLEGKVCAVTGASSGIGEATALALAAEGAHVVLGARRADRLDALKARIESAGGGADAVPVDITDEADAQAFVTGAHERHGRLDVLINNAGVMLLGPVEGADTAGWRRMIDVNLLGLLYTTHAALPIMREAGGGDLVFISSVAGRVASFGAGVYNMTKFGVTAFTEALRQEAVHHGTRVICVEPGFTESELIDHNPDFVKDVAHKRAEEMGKILEAGDIADSIVFALSRPRHMAMNELLIRPTGQR